MLKICSLVVLPSLLVLLNETLVTRVVQVAAYRKGSVDDRTMKELFLLVVL